jgi:hypothetical protein
VHVLVTLEAPDSGAWAHVAFDHVTVTATSGSQLVVVCLTPRAEGQRAFVAPSPSRDDPDPCADLHAGGFAGVNGVYPPSTMNDDWDLTTNPWEFDLDGVRAGDPVVVEARAVFGGAAAVGAPVGVITSRGRAAASATFPRVVLAFAASPAHTFWGDGRARCEAGEAIASWLEASTFASEPKNPVACPRTSKSLAYTEALRAAATPTLGTVGRVPAVVDSRCPGGEPDGVIVWKSDPVAVDAGCAALLLTGRFARCEHEDSAEPGCLTSVRCVPPPTDLVALSADGRVLEAEDIACVPSYPEPVQYRLTVRDADAGAVSLGLRRGASGGGCFFDIYDFSAQAGCPP